MALPNVNPTTTAAWQKLQALFETKKDLNIKELLAADPNRIADYSIEWEDFYVDFSKNIVDGEVFTALLELADEVGLKDAIAQYYGGETINVTEGRAVLHTALRAPAARGCTGRWRQCDSRSEQDQSTDQGFLRGGYFWKKKRLYRQSFYGCGKYRYRRFGPRSCDDHRSPRILQESLELAFCFQCRWRPRDGVYQGSES